MMAVEIDVFLHAVYYVLYARVVDLSRHAPKVAKSLFFSFLLALTLKYPK